jgi:aspartate/methionine/tyrosine aminotransferase
MPPEFVPFALERLLSTWENRVEYNLSESGVHPIAARDLLDSDAATAQFLGTEINYAQSNGLPKLRERIAALYPGANAENVLVTTGAIQANYTALIGLTNPGDDVAIMQPNYQQLWGVVRNAGRRLSTFGLDPQRDWQLNTDALARAVTPSTTLVAVVNPNNPTGRILRSDERKAIVDAAARTGAWLLADEVYAGTEHRTDVFTPTFYGEYERVLAVNSMSKAYGLPGLRLGWIVGPAGVIEHLWAWQDYITIGTGMLDNLLAAIALTPSARDRLIARGRGYTRRGFINVQRWANERDDVAVLAPDAAAICVVKYDADVDSAELAMRLIHEKSTLVVPGSAFGLERCLRVSFGLSDEYVNAGLARIGEMLDSLKRIPA